MTMIELLPERATTPPGAAVRIEVRGADGAPGRVRVLRLGELVRELPHDGGPWVELGLLPEGGYGVELVRGGGLVARTAVEVAADARHRLRYGFVAAYPPGADATGLADTVRRLHLTGVQFYDWAYRHAELLGGGEEYLDALGQPVSLDTVRRYVAAVRERGADPLGYAAVYAVGPAEWPRWEHDALLDAGGAPYALGDFLFIVDPASADWLAHLRAELAASVAEVGFAGFHLDQYGYPKRAERADGAIVDIAESFATMIEGVREELPDARLVFNQVNDFPTWRTAASPQDAVYIEPWEPQTTLGALAATATRARLLGGDRPVVLAAYQHVYDAAPADAADRATRLTMATLFSHGATQLLAGEADRILVDPYYVRNHVARPSTAEMLRRWYDFLVEHDELLLDPALSDVTAAYAGDYNGDCDVRCTSAAVSEEAVAGTVWRRITSAGDRLVVHLVNLVGQPDTLWDAARAPFGDPGEIELRVRPVRGRVPRIRVADPDAEGRLVDVRCRVDGDRVVATLPPLAAWQLVLVELAPEEVEGVAA
jgi:dextranase